MRWSTRRWITGAVFTFAMCVLGLAWASDQLSDFKAAAGKSGCEAIPYAAERNDCKRKQENKNSACSTIGCDLRGAEKLLRELEQKRKNLKEARERNNQSAIPALEQSIGQLDERLKGIKSNAASQIERSDACIKAREDVQAVFSEARKKVQAEKDAALKAYIDKLVAHYVEGAKNHAQALNDARTARANCKKVSEIRY